MQIALITEAVHTPGIADEMGLCAGQEVLKEGYASFQLQRCTRLQNQSNVKHTYLLDSKFVYRCGRERYKCVGGKFVHTCGSLVPP